MNPIKIDHEIMSGVPCFAGTRVPIKNFFDYVEHNHPLETFLEDFPTVTREQVLALLQIAQRGALDTAAA